MTAGDVGPQVVVLGECTTQLGTNRLIVSDWLAAIDAGTRERGLRHSRHDAVANEVVGKAGGRVRLGLIDNAGSHARTNGTNLDTGGGGFLGGLGRLGGGDLGGEQGS